MAFDWKNLTDAAKTAFARVSGDNARQKARDALAKAGDATARMKEQVDNAAQATAEKITQWTGRETTAAEVKRTALVLGISALAVTALGSLGAHPGMAAPIQRVTRHDWGNDFESQVAGFFAENGGSLNYETPYVDSEGQVYPV